MFSYFFGSFSGNGTCDECSRFVVLEARLSELETLLRNDDNNLVASQASLAGVVQPSVVNPIGHPSAELEQL